MNSESNGKPRSAMGDSPIFWGILCLILAMVLLLSCEVPKFIRPPTEPPPLPYGISHNVTEYQRRLTMSEGESCVVPYGDEIELTVHFRQQGSSFGHWSGSEPTLSISNESYVGKTHTDTWGDRMPKDPLGVHQFTPWLKVSFPIKQGYYHEWVDVTATMDISFPVPLTGYFMNVDRHLTCSLRFFVVSPEESDRIRDLIKQHEEWQHFQDIQDEKWGRVIPFTVISGLGVVLICVGLGIRQVRKRWVSDHSDSSKEHDVDISSTESAANSGLGIRQVRKKQSSEHWDSSREHDIDVSSTESAANREAQSVKHAVLAYFAYYGVRLHSSDDLVTAGYLSPRPKAVYTFDTSYGWLLNATPNALDGWSGITFQAGTSGPDGNHGKWVKS